MFFSFRMKNNPKDYNLRVQQSYSHTLKENLIFLFPLHIIKHFSEKKA